MVGQTEAIFIFSLIWTFGSYLDSIKHAEFTEFLKEKCHILQKDHPRIYGAKIRAARGFKKILL